MSAYALLQLGRKRRSIDAHCTCRGVSFDQHCNIEKRVQNSNIEEKRPEVEVVSISGPEEFASMAPAKAQERTDSLPQRIARSDLGKAIWLDCDPGHDDASKYES